MTDAYDAAHHPDLAPFRRNTEGVERRPFWVIERYSGDKLYYWSARGGSDRIDYFEAKIEWAVKLHDKESGSAILHRHLNGIGRVVEHLFVPAQKKDHAHD